MSCSSLLGVLVCVGDMATNMVVAGGELAVDASLPPSRLPVRVRRLYLTHGHADHFRYARGYRDSGAVVFAPRHCLALVENPSVNQMATLGWAGPVDPDIVTSYFLGDGVRVDVLVEPGPLGDGIAAVAAPGHTPGHTAYVVEGPGGRVLVAGDAVLGPGYLDRLAIVYHTNTVELKRTLNTLKRVDVDALVPGHGEPATSKRDVVAVIDANLRKVREMEELVLSTLPQPDEPPIYTDEVAARVAEAAGLVGSRRAYSILSPVVRALLQSLKREGLVEAVVVRGVIAWRKR